MPLKKLNLKDKKLFDRFLGLNENELAVYAFANIYIWKGLYDIYWQVIKNNLCIFFKDNLGCFMYLSPLGKKRDPEVLRSSFQIMDKFNPHKNFARIENIEEKDACFYEKIGYAVKQKPGDYLCRRADLAQLRGNPFKSKRASSNYFVKHYEFQYLPFCDKYKDACFKLYKQWAQSRKQANPESVYQGMLVDSQKSLKILLDAYSRLGLEGRVISIDKKIKAFTFGFRLSPKTFCILYEITDLSIKGLSQFIFRRFCAELENYEFINIMDDSGLENLKKVKLSYHPVKLIPSYIAGRIDG